MVRHVDANLHPDKDFDTYLKILLRPLHPLSYLDFGSS